MSEWIKCSDRLPDAISGTATEILVCVKSAGKQFVFSAQWMCGFGLYSEDHPDADEEGCFEAHGWYSVKESAEYAGWYEPIEESPDYAITHWQPLPVPPTE